MAWNKWENLHEIEASIEFTTEKSRLIEDTFTGKRYWLPKSCTYDFNLCNADKNYYLFQVNDWWWQKAQKGEFDVEERE
jgi:hypothetical protein